MIHDEKIPVFKADVMIFSDFVTFFTLAAASYCPCKDSRVMLSPWQASHSEEQTEAGTRETLSDTLDAYRVVLYNDEVHTFDEVILQIIKAIQCTRSKAEKHTWEVHTKGLSIIYAGTLPACLKVSAILEEIDLKTEIQTG